MVSRRGGALLVLGVSSSVALSCSQLVAPDSASGPLVLQLVTANAKLPPPPRPFVSTMDSLVVVVSNSHGAVVAVTRQKVYPSDTLVTIPVDYHGDARVRAELRSTNGTVLHNGVVDTRIGRTNGVVEVEMTPRAPVLLVSPDTVHLAPGPGFGRDSIRLFNRGLDTLLWASGGVQPPPSANQCPANCLAVRIKKGVVMTAAPVYVYLDTIPNTKGALNLVINTPQGSVQIAVLRQ